MLSYLDDVKKKVVVDSFLNRACEVVQFEVFKIWYWKGIALKKEIDLGGAYKTLVYAISIDEDYIIKPDEFRLPKQVKIKYIGEHGLPIAAGK